MEKQHLAAADLSRPLHCVTLIAFISPRMTLHMICLLHPDSTAARRKWRLRASRRESLQRAQCATHRGAAALAVVVQQAQSAQSLPVPQPVLRRVQHAVAAQDLRRTDKPKLRYRSTVKATGHTHVLHTGTRVHSLLRLPRSVAGRNLPLFQDKCPRIIDHLLRHNVSTTRCSLLPVDEVLGVKPTAIELPMSIIYRLSSSNGLTYTLVENC